MTSLQKIQALHAAAVADIEKPVDGYPGLKRGAVAVMFTRPMLESLAVVLRQAAKVQP